MKKIILYLFKLAKKREVIQSDEILKNHLIGNISCAIDFFNVNIFLNEENNWNAWKTVIFNLFLHSIYFLSPNVEIWRENMRCLIFGYISESSLDAPIFFVSKIFQISASKTYPILKKIKLGFFSLSEFLCDF